MHTVTLSDAFMPWLAASDDDTRPTLTAVWFDPCGGAVATDTQIMAVVPCQIEGEGFAGALVPADFLKDAYRQRGKLSFLSLTIEGDTVSTFGKHGRISARLIEGQFPQWKRVCPDLVNGAPVPIPLVNVNPTLYVRLRDALGMKNESSVPLAALGDTNTPYVMPGNDGAFGVLMPIYADKAQEDYGHRMNLASAQWLAYQGKPAAAPAPEEKPRKIKMKPVLGTKEPPVAVVEPEPTPAPVPTVEVYPAPAPSRLPAWLASMVG